MASCLFAGLAIAGGGQAEKWALGLFSGSSPAHPSKGVVPHAPRVCQSGTARAGARKAASR
eukprot:10939106-Lingulodinium_polyedra.AAC.1